MFCQCEMGAWMKNNYTELGKNRFLYVITLLLRRRSELPTTYSQRQILDT
jgi:hypothetical protein